MPVHRLQQARGVHRLDEVHPAHHILYLVGLEVTDEMDPGPVVGVIVQVPGELLHPVLPADRHPGGDGRPDGVRCLDLGGCHQRDLRRIAARLPGRPDDRFLYLRNVFRQRRHKDPSILYLGARMTLPS